MLRKTSQWEKRPQNGPWCHHRAAVGLVVTDKTTKDPWCHQTAVECLARTKKTTNCPWHHHSAVEGLAVKEETRKCFMVSPSCCGRPHGDIKDHKMVHGVTMVLQKSLRWQKRPNGSMYHHRAAEDFTATEKTTKWPMVSPLFWGRPRGDRKDQKLVHGVTILLRKASRWQKITEIDPWCHHHSVDNLMVTKTTENVTLCHYRSAVGLAVTETTRKWSMVSPSCCRRPHSGK